MPHQSADYLHEVGMLNRTPRSGFQFLGSADQSVAEALEGKNLQSLILGQSPPPRR